MPVFTVNYVYGPDTDTRMERRPAHRAWQAELHEAGTILASGPLDNDPVPGGLLILKAADKAEIARHLAADPYASIGVIDETIVREWTPVFGPLSAD